MLCLSSMGLRPKSMVLPLHIMLRLSASTSSMLTPCMCSAVTKAASSMSLRCRSTVSPTILSIFQGVRRCPLTFSLIWSMLSGRLAGSTLTASPLDTLSLWVTSLYRPSSPGTSSVLMFRIQMTWLFSCLRKMRSLLMTPKSSASCSFITTTKGPPASISRGTAFSCIRLLLRTKEYLLSKGKNILEH